MQSKLCLSVRREQSKWDYGWSSQTPFGLTMTLLDHYLRFRESSAFRTLINKVAACEGRATMDGYAQGVR